MRANEPISQRSLVVMDHNSVSGRDRQDFGGSLRATQSFRPIGIAAGRSDGGVLAEHTGAGMLQNRFYWQHRAQAAIAEGNPLTGEGVPPDDNDEAASFLVCAPGILRAPGPDDKAFALQVRDKALRTDDRYGEMVVEGLFDDSLNPYPEPQARFSSVEDISYQGAHDVGSEPMTARVASNPLPSGHPVLFAAASERGESQVVGYAGWTNAIICDTQSTFAKDGHFSTRMVDSIETKTESGQDRTAPIETSNRVVATINGKAQVAINGLPSAYADGLAGRMAVATNGSPLEIEAVTPPSPNVGYMSDMAVGPLAVGGGRADRHLAGVDRHGGAHVGGHINGQSPYYVNNFLDAKIQHVGVYQEPANDSGVFSPSSFSYDPADGHVGLTRGFRLGGKSGLHKFETLIPVWVPPEPELRYRKESDPFPPLPPEPPPPFPPPIPPPPGGDEGADDRDEDDEDEGDGREPTGNRFVGQVRNVFPAGETTPIPFIGGPPRAYPLDPRRWGPAGEVVPGFGIDVLPGDLGEGPRPSQDGVGEDGRLTPEAADAKDKLDECVSTGQVTEVITESEISSLGTFIQSNMQTSTPGMIFSPSPLGDDDYRFVRRPDRKQVAAVRDAPVTGVIVPFGRRGDTEWIYHADPLSKPQFRGGATDGGVAMFPPTESLDERSTAPDGTTEGKTYFALKAPASGPSVALGFGCPQQEGVAAGRVADGFVLRRSGDTLSLTSTGSDGAESADLIAEFTSEYARLNSPKQNVETKTADFDAEVGYTYEVDVSTGVVTVTLPDESGVQGERITIVSLVDTTINNVRITADGSGQIGDTDLYTISEDFVSRTFEATSFGWVVIGCSC